MMKDDLPFLKNCLARPNDALTSAGLLPTADHVVNLAALFPTLSLPSIIVRQMSFSSDYI